MATSSQVHPVLRVRQRASARLWPDALAVAALGLASSVLSWSLLTARDLDTSGGDWHAHAFRIEQIARYGLASWSHSWAGGMPLWEGYQTIPQLVSSALAATTGAETTRVMAVVAGLLLILMRVSVYACGRVAGASPLAALVGALVVSALDSVAQPLATYSELWGLAFVPLVVYLAYRHAGEAGGFVLAVAMGLAVEVHPLLAAVGGVALTAGIVSAPTRRRLRRGAIQAGLFLAGAAVFWLPLVTSARPAYSEPAFASVGFARLLYRLNSASFLPGWPMIAALGVLTLVLALRSSAARPAWFLLMLVAALATLIEVSVSGIGPEAVREAQLARLISVVPMPLGGAAMIGASALLSLARGRLFLIALAGGVAAVVLLRPSPFVAMARGADAAGDASVRLLLDDGRDDGGRVWADAVTTARASFMSGGELRFAGSYSGREWSIVHGALEVFMTGVSDPVTRTAYLRAHAVGSVLVPAGVRPEIADPRDSSPAAWEVLASDGERDLLRPPWTVSSAWTLPYASRSGLTVPDLRFRDVPSSYIRDETVRRYAAAMTANEPSRTSVRYPSPTTIAIDVASLDGERALVISENWDTTWRARADSAAVPSAAVPVERFGPNLLLVDLRGVSGDATITLSHQWPRSAILGRWLSGGALAVGLLLTLLARRAAGRDDFGRTHR